MARVTSIIREDAERVVLQVGEPMSQLAGSTLLITGTAGFLCSTLLDVIAAFNRQASTPCRVIAVDNFQVGMPERIAHLRDDPNIKLVHHDVIKPMTLDEPVDWIIHGASIASPIFYRQYPLETIDVNVQGTRHLLDMCRNFQSRSMIFLSTSEIYGDPEPAAIPTPETYRGFVSCTGPRACYDESKRLGETLCTTYFRLYATPVKVIRPFNVYGPGQRLDDQRIIPDLMNAVLAKRPIILFSDGRATRAFCYISDFLTGLLLVLLSSYNGEAFNIGNDEEVSISTAAECAAKLAVPGLQVEYRGSTDPHYLTDNPQRRCPDLTKMRTNFPWQPRIHLSEGLKRVYHSYREDMEYTSV